MKRLITRENAKQVGILYHYTSVYKAVQILKSNTLKCNLHGRGYVSFTRDQNFEHVPRQIGANIECRLVINGNKLSENTKIKPYHDVNWFKEEELNEEYMEAEERVKSPINPILPYIISLDIYRNKFVKFNTHEVIQKIFINLEHNLVDLENCTLEALAITLDTDFGIPINIM
ncbi:MAG: hypothetical protein ACOCP8_07770 [archaeon]